MSGHSTLLPTAQSEADGAPSRYVGSPTYRRHNRKGSTKVIVGPRIPMGGDDASARSPSPEPRSLAKGAGSLVGAQIVAKLLTFILNQALLRLVGAADFGGAARLEFLAATCLSLSRDAVRLVQARQGLEGKAGDEYRPDGGAVHGTKSGTLQETVNMGFVPLLLGNMLTALIFLIVGYKGDFVHQASAGAYAAACAVELLAEPCFLLSQLRLQFGERAKIESAAALSRTIVTFLLVASAHVPPVLGFACGQLAAAATSTVFYYVVVLTSHRRANFQLRPKRVWSEASDLKLWLDPVMAPLAAGMAIQHLVRYLLMEGDRIVVGLLVNLEEQGAYALAANYGSLLARLCLFPIEETLRSYFARVISLSDAASDAPVRTQVPPVSPVSPVQRRRRAASEAAALASATASPGTGARRVADTLAGVLRVYTYAGILAVGVGPLVASYLLRIVVSRQWASTSAPQVLAAYASYVPVMAWNGALEAFVQSVAELKDLRRQGGALACAALFFILLVWLFSEVLGLGAIGLVYAQTLTMALRAAWAFSFVHKYLRTHGQSLRLSLPYGVVAVVASTVIVSRLLGPVASFLHLCGDAMLCIIAVATSAYAERKYILQLADRKKPPVVKLHTPTKHKAD